MFEDRLPTTEFDVFHASSDPQKPSSIHIKIQQRRAKLTDSPYTLSPDVNCWRYVRQGSKEDGNPNNKVLDVFIGPILNKWRNVPLTIHFKNTLSEMDSR